MPVPAQGSFAKFITDFEIVPVILVIGISFIWPNMLIAAVICAAIFLFFGWVYNKRLGFRAPGGWGALLLVLLVPVTLWATTLPEKTLLQVMRLLSGIVLYFVIIDWCNSVKRLRMILPGVSLVGLGLALVALINVQWAVNKLPFLPASVFQAFPAHFSDTVHPNVLAGSLVILLPIIIAELLFAWKELTLFEQFINGLALIAILVVLGMTLSRGAWMAMGAVLVVMPAMRWRFGWWVMVLATAGSIGLIQWLGLIPIIQFLASSGTISGSGGRLEIWSRAVYMIQDFPFTGIGMGTFGDLVTTLYPLSLFAPGSIPHAHNLFLQIAVDMGIMGLIGWLLVFGSVIVASWKLYRNGITQGDMLAAGLGAGFVCSQLALTVHGLTDAVTWGMVRPAVIVWGIWGLAVASWLIMAMGKKIADQTPVN